MFTLRREFIIFCIVEEVVDVVYRVARSSATVLELLPQKVFLKSRSTLRFSTNKQNIIVPSKAFMTSDRIKNIRLCGCTIKDINSIVQFSPMRINSLIFIINL